MRRLSCALLVAALSGCGKEAQITPPLTPPGAELARLATGIRYDVITYTASLGGTQSRGMAINNRGLVAGWSNLPGNGSRHATLWTDGSITDLGTLGGPNSTLAWPGLNNTGMIVGISQTADVDPLHEGWSCEAGGFLPETGLVCRGFVWENGHMQALPTLGGTHGFATAVNNRGQVVGWAETPVHDPTCTGTQVLQFRAVLWEPKMGTTRELAPFPGDSTSAATAINQSGMVVGISGDCDQAVGRFSARHAVLWEKNGTVMEIPNLGGTTWHTPMDINARGDVVGFSNPPGQGDPEGEFISRAFFWSRGSETAVDLGTLPGDLFSEAFAINARGQVVGVSFGGANGSRAFLWQNGVMVDLNDLVDSDDVLVSAQDINDAGQITGRVRDHVTGVTRTFVATPVGGGQ
jgi:probable HAF family extracellular repeat protein